MYRSRWTWSIFDSKNEYRRTFIYKLTPFLCSIRKQQWSTGQWNRMKQNGGVNSKCELPAIDNIWRIQWHWMGTMVISCNCKHNERQNVWTRPMQTINATSRKCFKLWKFVCFFLFCFSFGLCVVCAGQLLILNSVSHLIKPFFVRLLFLDSTAPFSISNATPAKWLSLWPEIVWLRHGKMASFRCVHKVFVK